MSIFTVHEANIWADKQLERPGDPGSKLEGELLLAFIMKKTRIELLLNPHAHLKPAQIKKFKELVKKRKAGWPIAYLVGSKGFYDIDLIVTPDTLIPRPETELIIELVLAALSSHTHAPHPRILDIGTGPGTIALALAKHLPNAQVTGVDISKRALAVARQNKRLLSLKNARLVHSDLLQNVKTKPDIIVTNLPYLTKGELAEPSIKKEPKLALYGGPDGLALYKRLFIQLREKNWRGLTLYCEIGSSQAGKIIDLAHTYLSPTSCSVHQDYAGLDRVVVCEL